MPAYLPSAHVTVGEADGFVDRHAELAVLRTELLRVRDGEPRFVLIDGPGGIGKTRLVEEFLVNAGEPCVLRASGEETESHLPYGMLAQLISQIPTLSAESLSSWVLAEQPLVDPLGAGAALIDLLGELQRDNPAVLIVVDDAHWADRPSLVTLTFALRRLRADRVLAIVLTRDREDPRLPDGLRRVLGGEHGVGLRLAGLGVDGLRMLANRLGFDSLPGRAADRLRDHTGGNPLHARAVLQEISLEALTDLRRPLPAPHSFAMLVLARLAACPVETQALAAAVSVLANPCPLHRAGQLAELADPLTALEPAVMADLLTEWPGEAVPHVAFPHPLVRAAVYHDLGPASRSRLHARAAGLVDNDAACLQHRLHAASGPDDELTAELTTAARRHAGAGLWDVAATELLHAAQLADATQQRERLVVEAVEALLLAGQVEEATRTTAELIHAVDLAAYGYALGRLAVVTGDLSSARALLTDAWRHCDPRTDPELAARIAGQLAALSILEARGADAARWAGRALELSPEQAGSDHVRFGHLVGLGISGAMDQGLAITAALPNPAGASLADLDALLGRALLRTWTDDLKGAERDLAGVMAASRDRSAPFRLLASALLGQVEYRLGRWDDAVVHFELALSIAEDADQTWLIPQTHALAALVPAARGHWERAAAHVRAAYDSMPRAEGLAALVYAASAHAHLATARGDAKTVTTALRPLLGLEVRDGIDEPGVVPWHDLLVDALVMLGEHVQAEAVLIPFERLAEDRRRYSAQAAASRARGNLHGALREPDRAVAAFEIGLEQAAKVTMPFERARLELAYGALLRRLGKRGAAAEQLEAAQVTLEALAAGPYLERCRRELAGCGRSPVHRRDSGRALLTPQELAVARLVVDGLTNRQAARELVVSVKTIEYHLSKVYSKLGVRSRAQLTARLHIH